MRISFINLARFIGCLYCVNALKAKGDFALGEIVTSFHYFDFAINRRGRQEKNYKKTALGANQRLKGFLAATPRYDVGSVNGSAPQSVTPEPRLSEWLTKDPVTERARPRAQQRQPSGKRPAKAAKRAAGAQVGRQQAGRQGTVRF
jgi:hypothetical protein